MAIPQPSHSAEFLLEIRRLFRAPREKVFAAWAEREQLEKWMAKDVPHHVVIHHEQDIRSGGRWRMEVRDSRKNEVYWGQGTYLEVKPPEKIVFTWSWTREDPQAGVVDDCRQTEVTVEFFDRDGNTDLVLTHRGLPSARLREEHETGWIGCLNELEKTL